MPRIPAISPAPPDRSIRLEEVALSRGGRMLFERLTLDLRERRIGVLGDNGAGKSSFLRLLNGLLKPTAGRVIVDGLDTVQDRALLPSKIGFVFQNVDHQIVFPTVLEEVSFGLREQGLAARDADARAREALRSHGCADWVETAVHELSEGQKQRLCIIAIVAMNPTVLVLDEPFSSLDLPTRLALTGVLRDLPQRIVLASHDLDLLAQMDRVLWFENGGLRGDGRPDDVLPAYRAQAQETVAARPGAVAP